MIDMSVGLSLKQLPIIGIYVDTKKYARAHKKHWEQLHSILYVLSTEKESNSDKITIDGKRGKKKSLHFSHSLTLSLFLSHLFNFIIPSVRMFLSFFFVAIFLRSHELIWWYKLMILSKSFRCIVSWQMRLFFYCWGLTFVREPKWGIKELLIQSSLWTLNVWQLFNHKSVEFIKI